MAMEEIHDIENFQKMTHLCIVVENEMEQLNKKSQSSDTAKDEKTLLEMWLHEWDMEHLYQKFMYHGMNAELLTEASDDDLKELVPLIGERIKLKTCLAKKKTISNSSIEAEMLQYSKVETESMYDCQDIEMPDPEISLTTDEDPASVYLNSQDRNMAENFDLMNGSSLGQSFYSKPNLQNTAATLPYESSVIMRTNNIELPQVIDERKFFIGFENLKSLLLHNAFSRQCLSSYAVNGVLSPQERKKLVHLIIDELLNRHSTVSTETLSHLADAIVKIFVREPKELYFFRTFNGKRFVTGGKLSDRYRNQRKKFYAQAQNPKHETPSLPILDI